MRWATTEEVDSDDATMTRKTRNGKVFGTLGSQWCVRAGVDAEEAPGPASEQQRLGWDARPCRERPCKTNSEGTKWRGPILESEWKKGR